MTRRLLARDPEAYRVIGRVVSRMHRHARMHDLARELVVVLRDVPARGRLVNALEHMWGHVRQRASAEDEQAVRGGLAGLQRTIQALALRHHEKYLLSSTALSELEAFFEAA